MLQTLKKISGLLLLVVGLQNSRAFSFLGPVANGGDAWQVNEIGYNPLANSGAPPFTIDPDHFGPKNIGEEYRRNVPVMYYACDANFLDFFGSSGSAAVDQAFTIMNNSLTNVDGYSAALTEFPLNSQAENYTASVLSLRDVKSEMLPFLVEQMGLADSVRYVWCLHNRYQPPGTTCPNSTEYQVVTRNFDITASPLNQAQYSPYVNGSLYSYYIYENCGAPGASPPDADAIEILVDPLNNNPPVSALDVDPFLDGAYFTGLTRDDEAGLRYLLSTNTVIYETPYPGSSLVSSTGSTGGTNYGTPFILYSSNYTAFVQAALTNDPVTLSNLFPGLIITSSLQYVVVSNNIPTINYSNTYANVIVFTNYYSSNSTATLLTTNVYRPNGQPAGTLATNVTTQTVTLTGVPTGDYYIWTNPCGPNLILLTLTTNVVATTNATVAGTNSGLYYSQTLITYSTTHAFYAEPIVCGNVTTGGTSTTNAPGLYEGIGKVQFVKTSYDSLIGQFYQFVTNTYQMVRVVNNQTVSQTYQRVVTSPDILITAADLVSGPNGLPENVPGGRSDLTFQSDAANGLAGPGTIISGTTVSYNKAGSVNLNTGTSGLNQTNGILESFVWGSFDGTTNAPVVYPNGTSLANLANQVLVNLTPTSVPVGTNGVAYTTTTFVATGGPFLPPYTWSLSSGGLPAGLSLSSGGTISGTPTQSGTYDFILQLTDSLSRTVTWSYAITIK